ncbi:MAG TPA: alpha/beta fold hydrolase [Rudaea sp.]|uniref:alpha/beta hydrolase n=1 Tax=Rudaea sp. TaxID=2136325 RepID=UPI002F923E23
MASRVVMVHGAGGGGWEWAIWRRVFETHGWQVSAPDLLPASRGLAATQIEDYTQQVVAWTRASTEPATSIPSAPATTACVLIGASLGGLLAMLVAARAQPAALVLINPMSPAAVGATVIEPHAAPRDYPEIVTWGSQRSFASTARALPDADAAARLFALRRWRDESGAVLRAAASGMRVDLPRCPMLVLASESDDDVPPRTSLALAQACAAEFRQLPGASHVGPLLGRDAGRIAEQALHWCTQTRRA